jgi:hypothetical protein
MRSNSPRTVIDGRFSLAAPTRSWLNMPRNLLVGPLEALEPLEASVEGPISHRRGARGGPSNEGQRVKGTTPRGGDCAVERGYAGETWPGGRAGTVGWPRVRDRERYRRILIYTVFERRRNPTL